MAKSSIKFPKGKYFTITWSINENFGGMTNALLHRARAFYHESKISSTIITFDWKKSYDSVISNLVERKFFNEGVLFKNFWNDIVNIKVDKLKLTFSEVNTEKFLPVYNKKNKGRNRYIVKNDQGEVVQKEYYRDNGSLCILEKFDSQMNGNNIVFLCDDSGVPVYTTNSLEEIYFIWLDFLVGDSTAFITVDSKFSANFMCDYKRQNVVKTYLVHGAHISNKYNSPYSPLTQSRKKIFLDMQSYDAIVVLTEDQKTDIEKFLGNLGNLYVIPNSHRFKNATRLSSIKKRHENVGVMLASLTGRKQVDHAIYALDNILKRDKFSDINIFSFGVGDQEEKLHKLVEDLNLGGNFKFNGYTNNPTEIFKQASFSLLTSSAEGFGLVIIESMAAGCIPISYNMRYGPSQIIEHGVDGFLVEPDDIEALSQCISTFLSMSDDEKIRMREAALRKASTFHDSFVVPLWCDLFNKELHNKNISYDQVSFSQLSSRVESLTFTENTIDFKCVVNSENDDLNPLLNAKALLISFRARNSEDFIRKNIISLTKDNKNYFVEASFPINSFEYMKGVLFDAFFEILYSGKIHSVRISTFDISLLSLPYSTVHGNLSLDKRNLES